MRTLSATELRSQLRDVLDTVHAGEAVGVGAHRKPEAVVLDASSYERLVSAPPPEVLGTLLAHSAAATANQMMREPQQASAAWRHPGDSFGRIAAWLWDTGQAGRLALLVADLLAELRHHHPEAPPAGQRITLDRLLDGVRLSLPGRAPAQELVAMLQRSVPGFSPSDDVTKP